MVKKNILNEKIITTYSIIQRKFTWIKLLLVKHKRNHLVSQGVKHVSSPYLNANIMMLSVSYILNKNNMCLTVEDQYKGSGKARIPKYYRSNNHT